MTRYILHGGGYVFGLKAQKFFDDFVHGMGDEEGKLLYIPFAEGEIEDTLEFIGQEAQAYRIAQTAQFLTNKKFSFECAYPLKEVFTEQLERATHVFFAGGTTMLLVHIMERYLDGGMEEIGQYLENKTVVGLSAGANALCKLCYGLDAHRVLRCNGPCDASVIVHWGQYGGYRPEQWDEVEKVMNKERKGLPLLKLQPSEWKVIEQP